MPNSRTGCAVALAITALFVAACGSNDTSAGAGSKPASVPVVRPTLTGSSIQPPPQTKREAVESGRPKVVFDPCTWVPDDVIGNLGFDSSSRERATDVVGEYTFLTCKFDGTDASMSLFSGNITLEEDKARWADKIQRQGLSINGREAMIVQKTDPKVCDLDMRTKVGYFGVSVMMNVPGLAKGIGPCDHIVDIATALEPLIGKDN